MSVNNKKVRKPTKNPTEDDFWAWLTEGINKGYCSDMYCENHDATARNDGEEFDKLMQKYEGRDFCWSIVHIYSGVNG
jgi:hypothetical protein